MRIGKLLFVLGSLLSTGAAAADLHGSQEDLETGKNWEHQLQKRDDVTGHPYTTSYWTSTISGQPTVLSSVGTSYSTLEVTSSFSSEGGGAITIGPGFFDSLFGSSTHPPSPSHTLSSSSVTDTNGHTASQEPPKSTGTPGEQTSLSSASASPSTRAPTFQSSFTEPARPSQRENESSHIGQPSSVSSSNTDSRFETVSSNNKGSAISTSASTQSVKASQPASTISTTGTDLSYTPSSALSTALPSGSQFSTSRGGSSLQSLHTASRSLEMGSTMATGGPTSGVSTKLRTFETASFSSEITSKSVKRSRSDTLSSRNPLSSDNWNTASRTVLSATSGLSSGPEQSYASSSAAPSSHSLHVSRSETTVRSSKAERSSLSVQRPTNERSSSTIFTVSVDRTRASRASSGPVAMSTVSSAVSHPGSRVSSTSPAVASSSSKADTNSKPSSLARRSRTYGSSAMPLPSLPSGKPSAVNLLSSSTTVFKSNSETVPSAGVSKSGSLKSNVASQQVSDRSKPASTSNSLYSTGGASGGLTSRTASSTGSRMPLTKQNTSTPVWTTGKVKASSETVKRSSQQGTPSSKITGSTSRKPGNSNASGHSSQRLSAVSSVVESRDSSRPATMPSAPTSASMLVNSRSQESSLSSIISSTQSYPSTSSAKLLSSAPGSTNVKPVGPASTTLMPAKSSAVLTYVNSSLSRASSATVDNSASLISRKPSASQLSLASETSKANMSSTRVESKVSRTEAAYSSAVSGTESMTPSTATESAHSGPASYKTGSSDTNVGSRSTWHVSPSSRPSVTSTARSRPHNSGSSEIYTSAMSAPSNSVVSWQSGSSFTTNSFATYSELSSVASSSGFVVVDTTIHSSAVSATRSGEQPSVGPSTGSSSTALHTDPASSGGGPSEGSAMTGRSGGSTFTSLPVNSVLRTSATHSISERSVIPTSESSHSKVVESVSESKPGLSTTVTAVITIPTTVSASGSEHTTSILVTKTVVTACPSTTPRPGWPGVSSEVTQSATSTKPRARDSSSDTSFPQHSRESEIPSGSHTNPGGFTGSERPVPSTMTLLQPKATQATSGTDLVPMTLTIATTATITSSGNIRTPGTEMTTTFVATTMYSGDSTAALSSGEPDITSSASSAAIESLLPTQQQSLTTFETTVAFPRTIVSGGQAVTITESSVKTVTTLCSSISKTSATLSHPKEATITAASTASPPRDTTSSPYNPGDEQTSISSIGEENSSRVPTSTASSPTLKNTLSTQTASVSSSVVSTGLTTADSGPPSIASESSSEAARSSAAYASSSATSSRVTSTSAESASTVASTGLVQGTSTVNSAPAMTSRVHFSASPPAVNSAPRFGSSLAVLVLPLILTMSF